MAGQRWRVEVLREAEIGGKHTETRGGRWRNKGELMVYLEGCGAACGVEWSGLETVHQLEDPLENTEGAVRGRHKSTKRLQEAQFTMSTTEVCRQSSSEQVENWGSNVAG